MNRYGRASRYAAVVAAAVVGGVFGLRWVATPARTASASVAPRFVAASLDRPGVQRSLDDYAGHPVLLNVWATWCDPCREEMPSLERLHRDYESRGLRIVAVSIDDAGSESLITEFARENSLSFDILHDPKSRIMSQYGVRGVPQTYLLSRDHHIVATRFLADWSSSASRALIDTLLSAGLR